MSVNISTLKKFGISSGNYKKIFSATQGTRPKKVNQLIQLIAERIQKAREVNLRDFRVYQAIDVAYDAPFQQITPTLIKNFLAHPWKNADEARAAVESWGLKESDLFIDVKIEGKDVKMLNPPFLYQIIVPIVKAYSTVRLAKIFNERDTTPLLPYTPLKLTNRNQLLCEVLTDLVERICTLLGYPAVMREAIQNMIKYGVSIAFPREAWYTEKQVDSEGIEEQEEGSPKGKTITTKEGIRYHFPHPTRMFYDLFHPLTTLNSNTGCEFAGYWDVVPYSDILDNRKYWNRESIWFGRNWFDTAPVYWAEVYPCVLQFPTVGGRTTWTREDAAAYYNSSNVTRDKAIFKTEFFMKLVPKDWGLGQYDDDKLKKLSKTYSYPVWHRFVVAGDDCIIFAEPIPYTPNWFMGYDYDPGASRTSSLALETIPWQDEVGNILSQIILTGKQNLANVIFYDKYVVDPTSVRELQNSGSKQYVAYNFIEVDTMKLSRQTGLNTAQPFWTPNIGKQNIQELFQTLSTTLNLMERVLQITAQEAGTTASHQQSKAEIVELGGASTNRLAYTSSFVDEGIDAWQRQLHDAWQSYGDPDVEAEISPDIENLEKIIAELGFKIIDRTKDGVIVKGPKDALKILRLESFARRNLGPDQAADKEMAQVILNTVSAIAAQPELAQAVGADNLLTMLELAAQLGGGRKDFVLPRLKKGEATDPVPENVKQAIIAAQQATMQAISEKALKPIAGELAQDKQQIAQMEQILKQLEGIYKVAEAQQQAATIKAQETQQKMQIRQQEFDADQARKNAATQADIQRKNAAAQADIATSAEKTKADITLQAHESAAATQIEAHTAGVAAATEAGTAAVAAVPAKESVSLSYKDLPASVQRQAEAAAGFKPATESNAEIKAQKTPPKAPAPKAAKK